MNKSMQILLAIALVIASAGALHAASGKCTITAVEGSSVTLDCGEQAADFAVGGEVKIKSVKKKAVEGC